MPFEPREAPETTGRVVKTADLLEKCAQLFTLYLNTERHLNAERAIQLKKRIEVWAEYTGVRSRGGLTLDDRLLEYGDVKDAIIGLLQLIITKLEEGTPSLLISIVR